MNLLRFGLFLVCLGATGCDEGAPPNHGDDAGVDGSSGGYDASSFRALSIEGLAQLGASEIALSPGEVLLMTLRVVDASGAPVAGVRVDLALLGQGQDSTLSAFYVTSDPEGQLRFYVAAGDAPTTFQLRISNQDWGSTYLPIRVLDAPRAAVSASIPEMIWAQASEASVTAYAGFDCADLDASYVPASASANFSGSAAGSATLASLSTLTSYALVAQVVSGGSLQRQCIDQVEPGTASSVVFEFPAPAAANPP